MDLNAPLGMGPPPPRLRRQPVFVAAGFIALVAVSGLAFILARVDPRGGEPYVVASLPAQRPMQPKAAKGDATFDATPTGSLPAPVANNALVRTEGGGTSEQIDQGTLENGVRVHRGTEAAGSAQVSRGPLVIDVSRQIDAAPHKASPGGRPAMSAGKSTVPPTSAASRIAIYVGGMGLSQNATRTATEIMPPAVTLAFLPYGAAVSASVEAARAKGHEVLLQLPMQSAQGSPGPHALRPDEAADALASDLTWLMSRFNGYDGVTNLLGAPVTTNAATMSEVLKTTGSRNLFFVDDGTSKRSLAPSLAAQLNVAAAQVDVVLDATADPSVVRANLESLVTIARRKGQAIGMASGLPEHLAAIARFASDLPKDVTLVPVSSLVRHDANLAANAR